MKTIITLLLLVTFIILNDKEANGQTPGSPIDVLKDGKNSLLIGYNYNYNRDYFGEIGIVRGIRGKDRESDIGASIVNDLSFQYLSLSSEVLLDNKLVVCPKLGYHVIFLGLAIGVSILDYTDFSYHKFGCRPEIGLSLGGALGIHYGYTFADKNNNFNYSDHNLAIRMILGSWRESKGIK